METLVFAGARVTSPCSTSAVVNLGCGIGTPRPCRLAGPQSRASPSLRSSLSGGFLQRSCSQRAGYKQAHRTAGLCIRASLQDFRTFNDESERNAYWSSMAASLAPVDLEYFEGLQGPQPESNQFSRPMAAKGPPPLMPFVPTAVGPVDLSTVLMRNRIIFCGSVINSETAQRVISALLTLAAVDDKEDIKMYINCPGGSTYSVLAIFDCMQWIKPDVSTVCFGLAQSQGALLLAGGAKGKRFSMPNARIMIHQPQGGSGGTLEDVRRQVNELMVSRDRIDKMFSVFTGQPLDVVRRYTDRDRFFSAAEAMEFGLIDGLIETEY